MGFSFAVFVLFFMCTTDCSRADVLKWRRSLETGFIESKLNTTTDVTSNINFYTVDEHSTSINETTAEATKNISFSEGYFWQVSDIHWDTKYSQKGDPLDMCHLSPKDLGDQNNGPYGNFRCDSPWKLVKSAIAAMSEIHAKPDFIFWTGDNVPHVDNPEPDWTEVHSLLKNITQQLTKKFPGVPIYPVLGNHDSSPSNNLPPKNKTLYKEYLSRNDWQLLLPNTTWATFITGGFYSCLLQPKLRLIALNTILWYLSNPLVANLTNGDPGGHFKWLEEELNKASLNSEKVYIVGHIPPGAYTRGFFPETGPNFFYFPSFNKRFIHIVNTYHDVIVGQFFGHLHLDSFMLFSDNETVVNSLFLGPSVTPWYEPNKELYSPVNPAIRLYKYNRTSGTILDYNEYFLNLTKANNHQDQDDVEQPHDSPSGKLDTPQGMLSWELLYTFTEAYNLSDVSTSSLAQLYDKLVSSVDTFQQYFEFSTVKKVIFPCNSICRQFHLCSIANVDFGYYNTCVSIQNTTTPGFTQDYNMTLVTNSSLPTSYSASISEIFPDDSESVAPEPIISDVKPEPESHTTRNVLIGISTVLIVATLIVGIVLLRKRTRLFRGPRYVFFP